MRFLPAVTTALVVAFIGTSAMAQTTTAPATTTQMAPAAKPATTTTVKPKTTTTTQTDVSKACSAQADAKGLHGKERSKFRSECKKNGAKM